MRNLFPLYRIDYISIYVYLVYKPLCLQIHPIASACLGETHGLLRRRLDLGLIHTYRDYAADLLYIGAKYREQIP